MGNYIGKEPVNGFFTRQSLTTDGSTVTFTLNFTIASTTSILVLAGGVVQEPDVAYTLSGGGTAITFTTAPASNTDTYIHYLGQAIVQNVLDVNGGELILDVDADTTIHADTDDEIDFKIAGSDVITFKATGIHLPDGEKFFAGTGDDLQLYHDGTNSYLANSTGALKVATETSGIAVTIGHTTSEVTFGDNVTVTGNLTIGGTTNFGDFNITNVGSIALDTITNDGTDITLDSSGDIILDSAGNDIFFKAGGTTIGEFTNSSSDLVIKSSVSDKDMLFKGNDGGAAITALTLDMSAAGDATFNNQVIIGDGKLVLASTAVTTTAAEINLIDGGTSRGTTAVASGDGILTNDGGTMRMTNVDTFDTYFSATTKTLTNKTLTTPVIATISSSSNDMTLDAGADIILDADGADVLIKDGGTHIGNINLTSSNLTFKSIVSDKDMIFQGNDGGAGITALTLDMSAAGSATFNHDLFLSTADAKMGIGTTSPGRSLEISQQIPTIRITDTDASAGYMELRGAGSEFTLDLDKDDALASSILTFKVDGAYVMKFRDGASEFADGSAASPSITNMGDINTGLFFSAADTMAFSAGGTSQFTMADGVIAPVTDNDVDLGTSSLEFKDGYFDGTVHTDAINLNGTAITSTAAELNILDGVTSTAAELNYVDGVTSNVQTQLDTKASTGKAIAMAIVFG